MHATLFARPLPRRSPHGPCKTGKEKGRLQRCCTPAAPRGGRQPGRSVVGLLHACQQSNTCHETSPRPGLLVRPPLPPPPLTSARRADREAESSPSLPFIERQPRGAPPLFVSPNRIQSRVHVLLRVRLRARLGGTGRGRGGEGRTGAKARSTPPHSG